MNSNELRYTLLEGKYTLVFNQLTGEFKCLRHGERWRDLSGDKMVLALMQAVMNLEDAASDKAAEACDCRTLGHDANGRIKCVSCGREFTLDQDDKYVPVERQLDSNLEQQLRSELDAAWRLVEQYKRAAEHARSGVQSDDLIVWSDGTVCTGSELHQMTHMSDDYEVVKPGTGVYQLVSDASDGVIKYRKQHGQPTQRTTGVYNKFTVHRNDGRDKPGGDRHGAQYFVLDVTHDKFAAAALIAYADVCAKEYPSLADDLINCVQRMDEALK